MMAGDTRLGAEAYTIESRFVPKAITTKMLRSFSSEGSQADVAPFTEELEQRIEVISQSFGIWLTMDAGLQ